MVKNPPSNAGDVGSIPGRGTKIPHTSGQLSLHATTKNPHSQNKIKRKEKSLAKKRIITWVSPGEGQGQMKYLNGEKTSFSLERQPVKVSGNESNLSYLLPGNEA